MIAITQLLVQLHSIFEAKLRVITLVQLHKILVNFMRFSKFLGSSRGSIVTRVSSLSVIV